MNRFTAIYTPGPEATSSGLRQALEETLEENLAAGSYRLGAVALRDGQLAAEVAASLPREKMASLFSKAGDAVGCTLEKVGWGWLLSNKMAFELVDETSGALLYDPLADVDAQQEATRSYQYGRQQAFSLAVVLLGAALVLGLALGYVSSPDAATWIAANIITLVLGLIVFWMLLRLIGALVTPWSYLRSIEVDEAGIRLLGLLQRSQTAAWHEIDELQLADRRALLLSGDRVISFPVQDRLGMSDQLSLLRTIIQRAELLYVGGRVGNITYRKFDA
jgi:hypothetical protein